MSALAKVRELERQRREALAAGTEETVQRLEATVKELRDLVEMQLRYLRASKAADRPLSHK